MTRNCSRFGRAARYMCSALANPGKALRREFEIQLREAENEWRYRQRASLRSVKLIANVTALALGGHGHLRSDDGAVGAARSLIVPIQYCLNRLIFHSLGLGVNAPLSPKDMEVR